MSDDDDLIFPPCDDAELMGPEGGDGGGTIVAMGPPEDVAATPASHTGRFLQEVLGSDTRAQANPSSRRGAAARR